MKKKLLVLSAIFMVMALCFSSHFPNAWAMGDSREMETLRTNVSKTIHTDPAKEASADIQELADRVYQCDTGFPNDMTSEEVSCLLNDSSDAARKAIQFAFAHSQAVPNPMNEITRDQAESLRAENDTDALSSNQVENKVWYDLNAGETTVEVDGEQQAVPEDYFVTHSQWPEIYNNIQDIKPEVPEVLELRN